MNDLRTSLIIEAMMLASLALLLAAFLIPEWHRRRQASSQVQREKELALRQDELLRKCVEKLTAEFADRIPICRGTYSHRSLPLEPANLEIWYIVQQAATEKAAHGDGRFESLNTRTREELLYSGYFRNSRETLCVRLLSEETLATPFWFM
jgi:hypothetical protein